MSNKKDKTPLPLKIVRWLYPKVERIIPILAHRYFLRLFFTPLHYGVPEKEKKAESFAEKFTLDAANEKIQCYSWGKGKPVLLVHGWAGRSTQFRRFIKPLTEAGYKVVGFDGPAHGNSTGKRTNVFGFEETLKAIYKKIGVPEVIIAHSFGGSAALFAAMNGLTIKKLINIASPTIGDEIIHTYLKAINGSMATKDFFKKQMVKEYGKPFDEFTAMHFIRHLPEPVNLLLIHDQNDKEVGLVHAEALAKVYPAARLIKTKGLGHTRILKDNDVIQQCVTFIKEE
jgi:predicted alpha/beta hydrolase family esterase